MIRVKGMRLADAADPVPTTAGKSWLLIGAGLVGAVLGVAFSMMFGGWFFVLTLGAGVAFALGVSGLGGRGWWLMAPAFVAGVFGPIIWAVLGHDAVMDAIGKRETCVVLRADEHRAVKRPYVDYTLGCPSEQVEIRSTYSEQWIRQNTATVLVRPPLEPVFADQVTYNGLLLGSVPVAMGAVVLAAAALRRKA